MRAGRQVGVAALLAASLGALATWPAESAEPTSGLAPLPGWLRAPAPVGWPGLGAHLQGAALPGRVLELEPLLCVLDTGVDARHADLDEGKVVAWRDLVHGRAGPYDDHGHGTVVSSIAAGSGEAEPGLQGAAPRARLAVGKVMDAQGHGTTGAAAAGVAWCVEHGARVINLSLEEASCTPAPALARAVARALEVGVLVVATAGNRGDAPCAIHAPGSLSGVLTVGALDAPAPDAPRVWERSGRGAPGQAKPDVVAPGVGVRGALAGTMRGLRNLDGTSAAAPSVAGIAALLRAAHPGAPPELVVEALRVTARDGGDPGPDPAWGWGAVQPGLALAWLDARDPRTALVAGP